MLSCPLLCLYSQYFQSANPNLSSAASLFFGSETRRATSQPTQDASADNVDRQLQGSPQARKQARNSTINGPSLVFASASPAPKRIRRSNGTDVSINGEKMQVDSNGCHYEMEPTEPVSPTDYSQEDDHQANGMDVDDDPDALGSPDDSHMTAALTNGPSKSVQNSAVKELGPKASILTVPDRNEVTITAWNPHNASVLATAGEALCRIWFHPKAAIPADSPQYHDILELGSDSTVTSMVWNPDGNTLAVATHSSDASDCAGAISLWTDAGKLMDEFPAAQDTVLGLRWSPSGRHLLGIQVYGQGSSSVLVWDTQTSQASPPIEYTHVIKDAIWTTEDALTVCGDNIISTCDISSKVPQLDSWNEPVVRDRNWTNIRYDAVSRSTAVVSEETGDLLIREVAGGLRLIQAHEREITAIAYQPVTSHSPYSSQSHRLLATSSMDGTVKIWDAHDSRLIQTLKFGDESPVMVIGFTPDGNQVAAANWEKVLVFNTEDGGPPRSCWLSDLEKIYKGQLTNGNGVDRDSGIGDDGEEDGMSGPSCSLSWNSEGTQLAFGVGSQVKLIYFSCGCGCKLRYMAGRDP